MSTEEELKYEELVRLMPAPQHPSEVAQVEEFYPFRDTRLDPDSERGWHPCDLLDVAERKEALELGFTPVRGRIVEVTELDGYGGITRFSVGIASQFFQRASGPHQNKWYPDISVQLIDADMMRDQRSDGNVVRAGLATRWRTLLARYALWCVAEKHPLPSSTLGDAVYPEILYAFRDCGASSAQEIASAPDELMDAVKAFLRKARQDVRVPHVETAKKVAISRLANFGWSPDTEKRGRGRPKRSEQAETAEQAA